MLPSLSARCRHQWAGGQAGRSQTSTYDRAATASDKVFTLSSIFTTRGGFIYTQSSADLCSTFVLYIYLVKIKSCPLTPSFIRPQLFCVFSADGRRCLHRRVCAVRVHSGVTCRIKFQATADGTKSMKTKVSAANAASPAVARTQTLVHGTPRIVPFHAIPACLL